MKCIRILSSNNEILIFYKEWDKALFIPLNNKQRKGFINTVVILRNNCSHMRRRLSMASTRHKLNLVNKKIINHLTHAWIFKQKCIFKQEFVWRFSDARNTSKTILIPPHTTISTYNLRKDDAKINNFNLLVTRRQKITFRHKILFTSITSTKGTNKTLSRIRHM